MSNFNGIFLLDKPIGISSNQALQRVKRLFKAKKAGHTGSLDPLATGMLPICFGDATKFSQYLLDSDKTYSVTMQLGVRTTTSDSEGDIVSTRDVPNFTLTEINNAFDFFRGETQQVPSMFSALKHNGKPLYEYARQGITIDRAARSIKIDELIILGVDNPFVHFTVKCSKGTYVRSLVDDFGERFGCGAHVTQLRRLSVGPYLENQMMSIEKLESLIQASNFNVQGYLLPMDSATNHWPALTVSAEHEIRIKQGQRVIIPETLDADCVRLFNQWGEFFGIADVEKPSKILPKKLIALS